MADDLPELTVADAIAWRAWLAEHHADPMGVWLVLAKKGTTEPTSITYDQALDEALCHGWIDGQVRRGDEATYLQRFTPRRARSGWPKRNVGVVAQLTAERASAHWDSQHLGGPVPDPPPLHLAKVRYDPKS